ncbi:MAG: hypothetical protein GY711_25995 [bacterium]|nr:hypothetical protein [bacterium]
MQLRFPLLLALALTCPGALAQTFFVDANMTTGLDDGSSWDNAYQGPLGLQNALLAAGSGSQVYVADGTYVPTTSATRTISIRLENGVAIFGSFQGGESSPDERPPFGTAPSILTADLAGNDGSGMIAENSYHVVSGAGTNATAVLDGFVITGGNANGAGNGNRGGGILCTGISSPTVRNCRFVDNRSTFGGGAGYVNGAPNFTDCSFEDNIGGSYGGAFDIAGSNGVRFDRCYFARNRALRAGAVEIYSTNNAVLSNCVFEDNTVTGSSGGGALWIGSGGSTSLRNLTVIANTATVSAAAGLRVSGSNVSVGNSIFWDNTGPGGSQTAANQILGTTNVTYCIVEGGIAGTGNLATDPAFVDIAGGDFNLTLASPAIDAASNALVPAGILLDFARKTRFVDEPGVPDTGAGAAPLADIGAYEFRSSIGMTDAGCAPNANSTGSPALLSAVGTELIADNDVDITAVQLPANQFGYFLMSQTSASMPVSAGVLCLGSPQFRFSGDILNSMAAGSVEYSPDMNDLPQGQVFQAGETWYFQMWYRDGAVSNFSESLCFTWQ